MRDSLELFLGVLACTLPPGIVIALIVWAVRAGSRGRDAALYGEVEAEVLRLRGENATLQHRVSRLESVVAALEQWARSAPPQAPPVGEAAPPLEALPAVPPVLVPPAEAAPFVVAPANVAPTDGASTDAGAVDVPQAAEPADEARPTMPDTAATEAQPGQAEQAAPEPAPVPAPEVAPAPEAALAPQPEPALPPAAPPLRPAAPAGGGWERWIGVRGAAALGASILVLAGSYFFEYSIEHGLITPAMRMIAGTLVGIGCVLASELRLRRTHAVLANWLAGAGVAILYVAFWAGQALYDLYPTWAAGLLMVAVTGTCVTLALRRESPAIAVLGLLGGFITPLALSTGRDNAIGLFSYVLLLDGAMLWVAYKRRWAWMALLCLIATALYQNAWLFARLEHEKLVLGVAIVSVFAILFAALPKSSERDSSGEESPIWKLARSAGVILPLLFTVPLAMRQDLGETFWATAVQLVLLCAAACWVGRRHDSAILPSGAAMLTTGSMLGWALAHETDVATEVWQICGLALVIAAVFHLFAELDRSERRAAAIPASLAVLSMLSVAALGAPFARAAGLWPWLLVFVGLTVMGLRLGALSRPVISVGVAILAALGLGISFAAGAGEPELPAPALFLGVLVACAAAMQLAGVAPRAADVRRFGEHAAAVLALGLVPLVAMVIDERAVPVWAFYGATLLLVVLALFAAARAAATFWLPLALGASAFAHGLWVARRASGPFTLLELAMLGAAVVVLAVWPIVAPRSTRDSAWAWRTAALAGPLYLLALRHVYLDALGPATIGVLPLALAALSIGAATAVRVRGPDGADARRTALVWLTATAAGFVTLAIPLQLNQEWITIGWALEALALVVLWRRFDHAGLKYLAFALAAVVGVRLVLNPYVLGYYERSDLRILNWLSYTYLVPAASLVGMWALLRTHEIERRRPWEKPMFPSKHALLANLAASAAILVLFVWVNLTIVDWFASGPELTIPTERLPARDLSISMAWALFALSLLALGLWRKSTALRVTSLGLVLVTCGKAFLYDLAHLSDLYRVASLVGLALSLIVISLVYQRFVFRAGGNEPEQAR